MGKKIHRLLIDCTVRIEYNGKIMGTGFFVGENRVLTCAHVVNVVHEKQDPSFDIVIRKDGKCASAIIMENGYYYDSASGLDFAILELRNEENELAGHSAVYQHLGRGKKRY